MISNRRTLLLSPLWCHKNLQLFALLSTFALTSNNGNLTVSALACNSFLAVQRENLQTSMEIVTSTYSSDLRNLILYLLTNPTRIKSVNDLMPMIGEASVLIANFFTSQTVESVTAILVFELYSLQALKSDLPREKIVFNSFFHQVQDFTISSTQLISAKILWRSNSQRK